MSVNKFEIGKQYKSSNGHLVVKVLRILDYQDKSYYINEVEVVYRKSKLDFVNQKTFSMFTNCWNETWEQNIWLDLESRLLECRL